MRIKVAMDMAISVNMEANAEPLSQGYASRLGDRKYNWTVKRQD